ncbi:hypothetical protein [Nocardia mangyaensis]|uniref:hypothetical protein n=1 Tax=Nocardia mangyaensis TaxID=2213200 RepID=UPI0026755604|nr:hypothetical protein [Nocardia mangyaensis]MDO3650942.1 hypothetical protein [Nocardia mangyaensis]
MTYGQQQPGYPPAGPKLGVGDALGYAWEKFKNNAVVWIAIVLIAFLIQLALNLLFSVGNTGDTDYSDGVSFGFSVWGFIGTIVSTVVGYLISAAFVRGALHEIDGHKPGFGAFFQFSRVGAVILAGLLVGVATGVGLLLCILPGLVIAFFTWWTMQFVIDQDQDPVSAIKSSFSAISSNAGPLLLLALALFGINVVGALLCGLGLLVSIPLTIIASTYAYRVVVGGPVVGGAAVPEPGYPQPGYPQYGGPAGGFGGQPGGPGYGGPGYGGPAGDPGYGGPAGGPGYGGPAGGPGYGGPAGGQGYGGPAGEPGYGGPGGPGYGGPPASGPGAGGPGYGATPAGGPGYGDQGYPGYGGPGSGEPGGPSGEPDSGPDLGKPNDPRPDDNR